MPCELKNFVKHETHSIELIHVKYWRIESLIFESNSDKASYLSSYTIHESNTWLNALLEVHWIKANKESQLLCLLVLTLCSHHECVCGDVFNKERSHGVIDSEKKGR